MDRDTAILELARRWIDAERHADTDTLDAITTDDFTLVGPLGFILDKPTWLDRYRSGALHFESLRWDDTTVRFYGPAALRIGRQRQNATYLGQPNEGEFRVTQLLVQHEQQWQMASMHISPLTASQRTS
jgi:ketosteroid isomerase-like protein